MSEEMIKIIQALSSISSVLVAIIALIIAYRVERRTQARFSDQLDEARKLSEANVKPLLCIYTRGYINDRGLRLENQGLGTAIITNIIISRGNREADTVVDLINMEDKIVWDSYWRFRKPITYLAAGDNKRLVALTLKRLEADGFNNERAMQTLDKLKDELNKISIEIKYSDVFGNEQPPCRHHVPNDV